MRFSPRKLGDTAQIFSKGERSVQFLRHTSRTISSPVTQLRLTKSKLTSMRIRLARMLGRCQCVMEGNSCRTG